MKAPLLILFFSFLTFNVSAQITVNSSGNVGVRTSSPLSALHVNGSLSLSDQRVSSVDANYIYYGDMMGGDGLRGLALRAGDQNRMYITTAGNVGIGTSSPTETLTLGSSQNILLGASGGTGGALLFSRGYASSNPTLAAVTGAVFYHHNGGTLGNNEAMKLVGEEFRFRKSVSSADLFTINTVGNIGIGTSSPQRKLEVAGPTITGGPLWESEAIRASSTSHSAGIGVDGSGTHWGATIFQDGVRRFILESNGGALLGSGFLGSNAPANGLAVEGNMGIGTTSPAEKLQVVGKVQATSFIADVGPATGYADFVFDDDYELMPLSGVEAHIAEHGHLPDIPSEAEAMANGIDLAAMQVKLLQKIEELTLHVIRQQKEIEALRTQRLFATP